MRVLETIAEARALGLGPRAVDAIVFAPDPPRTLAEARQIVALCAYAKRPELADEHVGRPLAALHSRLVNDRAAADEALHIDTTPPTTPSLYEHRQAR